ncbi:hypothetical protein BGZ49_009873 [Haplosporangium sp. Z 27]|nr:hypothetical protein BGZ49_009873 [Haplosporangium sp. Z 27]
MQELKRIKTYTEKLRHATHGNKSNMEVDKDAAARFIKGALAANVVADRLAEAEAGSENKEPQGAHTRFTSDDDKVEKDSESNTTTTTTRKRGMDPFHGYGEDSKKSKSG